MSSLHILIDLANEQSTDSGNDTVGFNNLLDLSIQEYLQMPKASYTINRVLHTATWNLNAMLANGELTTKLQETYRKLHALAYGFYVVDQARGFCTSGKAICIPQFVTFGYGANTVSNVKGRLIYYCAHEMAHALVGIKHQHNKIFMDKLIELCPTEYIHYELEYKPSHTLAIGMASKEVLDDL